MCHCHTGPISKAFARWNWTKPGATVIYVEIQRNWNGTGHVADEAYEQSGPAEVITPVPCGMFSMTIACLLRKTLRTFRRKLAAEAQL